MLAHFDARTGGTILSGHWEEVETFHENSPVETSFFYEVGDTGKRCQQGNREGWEMQLQPVESFAFQSPGLPT